MRSSLDPLVTGDTELAEFLEEHPAFDLLGFDFHDRDALESAELSSEATGALRARLAAAQRVLRVARDPEATRALLDVGLDSAHRIAAVPEHRFVRSHADLFADGEHGAREAHRRAVAVKAHVKHVHANLRTLLGSPHYASLRGGIVDPALRDYVEDIPTYRDLFGPLGSCSCAHCASIFGPGAYFVDLMRITEQYITEPNETAGTIPDGYRLIDRRPDLFDLELTCENVDRPVATLEIANRVMGRAIESTETVTTGTAAGGTASTVTLAAGASPSDSAYAGMAISITGGTGAGQRRTIASYAGSTRVATVQDVWSVNPDATSTYVVARDPYMAVAAAPYPFDLPWNRPLAEIRRRLGALGVELGEIFSAAAPELAGGAAQGASTGSITLASATPSGPAAGMVVELVAGTGAGQVRTITSYDDATKVATVDAGWMIVPDATTHYQVFDRRAANREWVGLSLETFEIVATPRITSDALAPFYGYSTLDLAGISRVDTFLARTGLTRDRLDALLVQGLSSSELATGVAESFFVNASGEGLPAMQVAQDRTDPNSPFWKIANTSIARLDRINRFVRLADAVGWSFEALDWALRSLGATTIDAVSVAHLAVIERLRALTGLDVVVLCALWHDVKTIGRGDGPAPADLFDRTFNDPRFLAGADPYESTTSIPFDPSRPLTWDPGSTTGEDPAIRARLRGALGVDDAALTALAASISTGTITLDLSALSALYRLVVAARAYGLSVTDYLSLLELMYGTASSAWAATVGGALEQHATAAWLQGSPFDIGTLEYAVNGASGPDFAPPYSSEDAAALVESLAATAAPARLGPQSFVFKNVSAEESAAVFEQIVAAGLVSPIGILLESPPAYEAAAGQFVLRVASFEVEGITAEQAAAVFLSLTRTSPPVLVPHGDDRATLGQGFTPATSLDFLFDGAPAAANERNAVRSVLVTARRRILAAELAFVFPLRGDSFASPAISELESERTFTLLSSHSPLLVVPAAASGQTRTITAYDGPTRTATVAPAWTPPSRGAPYRIRRPVASGAAQGGNLRSLTLGPGASTQNGAYTGMQIALTGGAAAGQDNVVTAYDGTTKVAKMLRSWGAVPDATTTYAITAIGPNGETVAADATQIALGTEASTTNGAYTGMAVELLSTGTLGPAFDPGADLGFLFQSTGAGQATGISSYDGATRRATVAPAWTTAPNETSYYEVTAREATGAARGGTATTIVLADGATVSSGTTVSVTAGTGAGQQRAIAAYDAASATATVSPAWTTVPDTTSEYEVVRTVTEGKARGGGTDYVLLDPSASDVSSSYDGMTVALVADPAADLKRAEVAQVLLDVDENLERAAEVVEGASKVQLDLARQGLADFLRSTTERLAAVIPIASKVSRLADYLDDLLTPPEKGQVPGALATWIASLSRWLVVVDGARMDAEAVRAVAEVPEAFNVSTSAEPRLQDVVALARFTDLGRALGCPARYLVAYLRVPSDGTCPGPKTASLAATGRWSEEQLCQVLAAFWPAGTTSAFDYTTVAGVRRVASLFSLGRRAGLGAPSVFQVEGLAGLPVVDGDGQVAPPAWQTYEAAAGLVLAGARTRFGAEFAAVDAQAVGDLREAARDALLGFAVWALGKTDPRIAGPESLYEHLLVDVQTASCDVTSPIAQGIASVQLYMQRCRMMLEPGVEDLSHVPEVWWSWMSAYRVWEANRKVFLYPENYLDPTLRRGASPQYESLVESLLQRDVTDASAEDAYRGYFEGLSTLAGLVIADSCQVRLPKAGTSVVYATGNVVAATQTTVTLPAAASQLFNRYAGMTIAITGGTGKGETASIATYSGQDRLATVAKPWTTVPDTTSQFVVTGERLVDRLFLIGRTNTDPCVYYHRRWDSLEGWDPWREIKLSIPSQLAVPCYAFDRLHLFWAEPKTVEQSRIGTDNGTPTSIPIASSKADLRFSYLRPDGTWTPPQDAASDIVFDYEENYALDKYVSALLPRLTDSFSSRSVFWRKPLAVALPATQLGWPSAYPNGDLILLDFGLTISFTVGQVPPAPTPPAKANPPDQVALEEAVYDLVSHIISIAGTSAPNVSGYAAMGSTVAITRGLDRSELNSAVFSPLRGIAPTPYVPALNRGTDHSFGIGPSPRWNVVVDNYLSDDYPAYRTLSPPIQWGLLGNISAEVATVLTVKNLPGSFVFNNGDEAFLVRSADPGILTLSELIVGNAQYPPFPEGFFYLKPQTFTTTSPPPDPATLSFSFSRLTTSTVATLAERLKRGGVAGVLTVESQKTPELPFARLAPTESAKGPPTDVLDFDGAFGPYFWEVFFHAPFLVAAALNAAQRFEDAKRWLEFVFNPTQQPDPNDSSGEDRFWRFLPFRSMTLQSLTQILTNPAQISAYNDHPFDPDAIARLRIAAYAKAIVMRYLRNLLDWGDFLFAQDTRESIDRATNLYVTAREVLGPRPAPAVECSAAAGLTFAQIEAEYAGRVVATGTAQSGGAATITLASSASPVNDAYTGAYVSLQSGTGAGQTGYVVAYDGVSKVATTEADWVTPPDSTSAYEVVFNGIPEFLIRLENSSLAAGSLETPIGFDDVPFTDVDPYFCVPDNDELTAYWDRVDDRLFKIRNCMNLAGQVRPLPLYAPPIDPRSAIAQAAAGSTGMAPTAAVQMPIPNYRFSTLVTRAREMTAAVAQLGGSLLMALERRDIEAMARLQASQQQALLDLTTYIKEQQIDEARRTGDALDASLQSARRRQQYYQDQVSEGLSPAEQANIATMTAAAVFSSAAGITRAAASIAYAVPNVGSPFAMTYGGQQIGSALYGASGVFDALSALASFGAQLSVTLAQYQRREEEWRLQADLARMDVDQIAAQIAANEARLEAAERDLAAQELNIAQVHATQAFLEDKFTNEELYQWMAGRLGTLHFQTYSLALELARSAERAYQYELGSSSSFVNFGYWDGSRRGLLSGEALMLTLNQMEKSYLDANGRRLEIEKTISLLELNPRAVLDLVQTGECIFELPEKLFDDDFPGHYARRIYSIAISIPAVTGPYQNVHATLTQLGNQVVTKPDTGAIEFLLGSESAPRSAPSSLQTNWWSGQQIALSTGVNDAGMLQPMAGDDRYRPFEGTGAVSSWRLTMPKATNRMDFRAISDVIVHLAYTALDGGERLRQAVTRIPAMRTSAGTVFLPLAQRFSSAWYQFIEQPTDPARQVLSFDLEDLVPPHLEGAVLSGFTFHLQTRGGVSATAGRNYLRLGLGSAVDTSFDLDERAMHTEILAAPPKITAVEGSATLAFDLADTPPDLKQHTEPAYLDPSVIENAVLILLFTGTVPWN